jgi:hypothetical protein
MVQLCQTLCERPNAEEREWQVFIKKYLEPGEKQSRREEEEKQEDKYKVCQAMQTSKSRTPRRPVLTK